MVPRRHRLLLLAAAFALVGAMATAGCSKSSKSAATTTTSKVTTTTSASVNAGAVVDISEYLFSPAAVTIKAGQSVEWKNQGNVAHTVTETTSPHTFASNDIDPGQTYTQTFNKPGTYSYVCSIHPDRMQGTITVTAAST